MTDQTVASLTDRLAAYMVEAFLDGRGYDPGDKTDVEVTLKEGFHTVLTEMRKDQAAGTATYDGLLPFPTPCRHSIYHHGCPSCDRQDPEDR